MGGGAPQPASNVKGILLRHAQHLERRRGGIERHKRIHVAIVTWREVGGREVSGREVSGREVGWVIGLVIHGHA